MSEHEHPAAKARCLSCADPKLARLLARRVWRRLSQDVDAVLHEHGDPLGVVGEAGARGEYAAYAPEIVRLLMRGAPVAEIAALLTAITRERMGLTGDEVHDRRVAERLTALRKDAPCAGS